MRIRLTVAVIMVAALLVPVVTMAHVVVKPEEVGVASFQTFTVGVPNEKDVPVSAVRLLIPEGVNRINLTVKPGWTITTKQSGEGESAKVTEIEWTGGQIPVGYRDDFSFSAQAPDKETELQWKAYQTYSNGVTVAWDLTAKQQPKMADGSPDFSVSGPFSTTKIVNDLGAEQKAGTAGADNDQVPFWLSLIAVLTAAASFLRKPNSQS